MNNNIRNEFPALKDKKVIYFDSACTTLKPYRVIEAMNEYYSFSGCHKRGSHSFSRKTTEAYEKGRDKVRKFINAGSPAEIIFTKNTTEAINLISYSFPFKKNDIVLTTNIEHNSNFLPWMRLASGKEIIHKILPVNNNLTFDLDILENVLKNNKITLISILHTSNLTGATFPVKEIISLAHRYGAQVLLDGAQSVTHHKIDIQNLDADFFVFSAHKIFGPPGVGILYGKKHLLENLAPFIVGGETAEDVNNIDFVISPLPDKFEAGIQNYPGVTGFSEAINFIENIGIEKIHQHVTGLNRYLTQKMSQENIEIIGPKDAELRGNIFNFICPKFDSIQLAQIIDEANNIMVRAGVHCVHSWFNQEHKSASARISFQVYNTREEIDIFYETFKKIMQYY
ncbi:MAG: cysteine desulfurase [bacterium]|nr:cysteine desulfurase [bacterium]